VEELVKVSRNGEPDNGGKGVDVKEDERKDMDDEVKPINEAVKMEETLKDEVRREEAQPEQDEYGGDDGYEEYGDRVDFEDPGEDDFEDPDEPAEEADAMEDERRELTAVAKERKIKKEYEIFVGGLDRDATEEDLRKVFEKIGEVVEVRLHKNLSTNRNKGYAFVKFASKEHVKRALSEMKNPVVCITSWFWFTFYKCNINSSTVHRFVESDVGQHQVRTMIHCSWEIYATHGQRKL
jgi:RNA recognition motif-containing protein